MSRVPATAYNQYLKHYTPFLLRRYQTGKYAILGRRSAFNTLVLKFSGDHLGTEEHHSFKHVTPIWFKNFTQRVGLLLSVYSFMFIIFWLGKQQHVVNMDNKTNCGESLGGGEGIFKYEDLYVPYRAARGSRTF